MFDVHNVNYLESLALVAFPAIMALELSHVTGFSFAGTFTLHVDQYM